jgi:DNA-binding transcriptional ArsR family regulator
MFICYVYLEETKYHPKRIMGYVMKKADKRLQNLIQSDICQAGNMEKYRKELLRLAQNLADVETAKKQSKFFKALSDEKRLRILKLLKVKEMCVCELMIALQLSQPNLSHHLRILENNGIISSRREGKWVYYSIANAKSIDNLVRTELM